MEFVIKEEECCGMNGVKFSQRQPGGDNGDDG